MDNALSTSQILETFSAALAPHRGTISDTYHDDTRLFVRSILPLEAEARPGDKLNGGIALRASDGHIAVHPYLFRQVCKNGAISATSLASRRLENAGTSQEVIARLHAAVEACSAPEIFAGSMRDIRTAAGDRNFDMVLNLMTFMNSHRASGIIQRHLKQFIDRFFHDGDQSRFGLMNAVTATARETPDPETRWTLEELGGGIPAMPAAPTPRKPAARRMLQPVG